MNAPTLNKQLFLEIRSMLGKSAEHDAEFIKETRDDFVKSRTGKSYKELTRSEMQGILNELQVINGKATHNKAKLFATPEQRKAYAYYSISCAVNYFDFAGKTLYNDGEMYDNEEIRNEIFRIWEQKKSNWLPPVVFGWLHSEWINPKSNAFARSKGWKLRNRADYYFDVYELYPYQANELIKYYKAMLTQTINRRAGALSEQYSSQLAASN